MTQMEENFTQAYQSAKRWAYSEVQKGNETTEEKTEVKEGSKKSNTPISQRKNRDKLNIERIEQRLSKSPKRYKETGILFYPYESESGRNTLYKAVLPNKNVFYLRKKEGKYTFYDEHGCLLKRRGKECRDLTLKKTRGLIKVMSSRTSLKQLANHNCLNIDEIEAELNEQPKRDKETGILLYPYKHEVEGNKFYKAVLPNKSVFYLQEKKGKYTFYDIHGRLAKYEGKRCCDLNSSATRYLMNMLHARDGLSVKADPDIYGMINNSLDGGGFVHPERGFFLLDGKKEAVFHGVTVKPGKDGQWKVAWQEMGQSCEQVFQTSQELTKAMVCATKQQILLEQRAKNAGRDVAEQSRVESMLGIQFFGEKNPEGTKFPLNTSVVKKEEIYINNMERWNSEKLYSVLRFCRLFARARQGADWAKQLIGKFVPGLKTTVNEENNAGTGARNVSERLTNMYAQSRN